MLALCTGLGRQAAAAAPGFTLVSWNVTSLPALLEKVGNTTVAWLPAFQLSA